MPKDLIFEEESDIDVKKEEIQLISMTTCDTCKERKNEKILSIQNKVLEIELEITGLTHLLADLEEDRIHIIWIKLPNGKELGLGDTKVLTLEYATPKEDSNEYYKLNIFSPSKHHVYYTTFRLCFSPSNSWKKVSYVYFANSDMQKPARLSVDRGIPLGNEYVLFLIWIS